MAPPVVAFCVYLSHPHTEKVAGVGRVAVLGCPYWLTDRRSAVTLSRVLRAREQASEQASIILRRIAVYTFPLTLTAPRAPPVAVRCPEASNAAPGGLLLRAASSPPPTRERS